MQRAPEIRRDNDRQQITRTALMFMPFMIPIVAIVMSLGLAMLAIYINYRKKKDIFTLYHQERLAALEKGVELPPLPDGIFEEDGPKPMPTPRRHLFRGLVWTMVGLALLVALYANEKDSIALYALLPIALGLAHLTYYFLVGKAQAEAQEAAERARLVETNPAQRV